MKGAFKSMNTGLKGVGDKLSLTKGKYTDGLVGNRLEELIRKATAKNLPGPDATLNTQVVNSINAEGGGATAYQIAAIIRKRLEQPKPHKQYLAIMLTQEVLQNCSRAMEAAREELLQDVAKIAAKPMNRYSTDLPGQQEAKNAAFALLRQYGREGQDVLRDVTGAGQTAHFHGEPITVHDPGAVGPRSSANSFQQLKEQIQTGVAQATSHTEMLQDMVLRMSQDDSSAADPHKGVLKDLVKEMISFRNGFESKLSALSQFQTDEANALMTKALTAMDMMNNAIELQNEVLTARKNNRSADNTPKRSKAPPPALSGYPPAQSSAPQPSPPATPAGAAPGHAPAAPPSPLDAILELQQGLDASYGPSHYPTQQQHQQPSQDDPFAASSSLHSEPFSSGRGMPSGGGSSTAFGSTGAGNGGSGMFGGSDFSGQASHQRTTSSASSNNPFAPGAGLHSAGPSLQSQDSSAHGVSSPTTSMSGGYPGPAASSGFQAAPSSYPSSSGGPAGPAGSSAAYPSTNLYPSIYSGTGSQGSGQYAQQGSEQFPGNGGGQYAQQGQGSGQYPQQGQGSGLYAQQGQGGMPNGFGQQQLQAPGAQQRSLGSGQLQAPSSTPAHQQPAPAADGFETNTFGGPSSGVEGSSRTSGFGGSAAPPRAGSMAALRAQKLAGQQPQQQPSPGQTGSGIWQSGSGVPLSSPMSTNSGWQSGTTMPHPKQGSSSDTEFDMFFANRFGSNSGGTTPTHTLSGGDWLQKPSQPHQPKASDDFDDLLALRTSR